MNREATRRSLLGGALGLASTGALGPAPARAAPVGTGFRRGLNLFPWFYGSDPKPWPDEGWRTPAYPGAGADVWSGQLKSIRAAGFDFARVPVNPGPLLTVGGAELAASVQSIVDGVRLALDVGLNVLVDLHPSDAHEAWSGAAITADPMGPRFAAYLTAVRLIAAALARFPQGRVALEMLNEPSQACGSAEWNALQSRLLASARSAAPRLPIVITGACSAAIKGLTALPAVPNDPNLFYTFHYYDPFGFTHQGATWTAFDPSEQYVRGLNWPTRAHDLDAEQRANDQTLDAIKRAQGLPRLTRTNLLKRARDRIHLEFERDRDQAAIRADFAVVRQWADGAGILPQRIIVGEFGVLRKVGDMPGADEQDAARWLRAVRSEAEAIGFGWAVWSYSGAMGILRDGRPGDWDPVVVEALGLKMPPTP